MNNHRLLCFARPKVVSYLRICDEASRIQLCPPSKVLGEIAPHLFSNYCSTQCGQRWKIHREARKAKRKVIRSRHTTPFLYGRKPKRSSPLRYELPCDGFLQELEPVQDIIKVEVPAATRSGPKLMSWAPKV
ncbi:hypothetical protein Moror_1431 [Moniliophthora roreri MCA 2997]|uniref:Uncharacterized protein n=1 Tax=Moniliophthora roreri (strain MCA 2997) TaxID=1381753 RepID=V2X3N6_MONRO|nr:hypothetical protein Moror_1431 [Moniliophthora roreri MCA 2997]KAI3596774.1 hypothetical protein WG66_016417 [Moniliophthora roreri]